MKRSRHRVVAVSVAALLVLAGSVVVIRRGRNHGPAAVPTTRLGPAGSVVPADAPPGEPVRKRVPAPAVLISTEPVSGAISVTNVAASDAGAQVTLVIDAPAFLGAEMQVSTDGSFAGVVWGAYSRNVTVDTADAGYQMVFARFRRTGGPATRPLVAGFVADARREAATSTAAGSSELHRASFVGRVAADQLVVEVETGRVETTPTGQKVVGRPLDVALMQNALLIGRTDGSPEAPKSITRTSRPRGVAASAERADAAMVHQFFITTDTPMIDGVEYTVVDRSRHLESASFTFDPAVSRSPAIQMNQLGFALSDEAKVAYLSSWNAAGGVDYANVGRYTVRDANSGRVVATGTPRRREIPEGGEYAKGDLTWAGVWELDLGGISTAGTYRVCVDHVGCSWDVPVTQTGNWLRAATTVARAMFHQRSGIALGPPFTSVVRPRPAHPDDGVLVRATDYPIGPTANGLSEDDSTRFGPASKAVTSATVEGAWGGHMDAGDWDRRVQHLWYLRTAAELIDEFPDTFERLELDIPESGDAVPDVLDEGLWSLELYRRMQAPDGGIRGGIEYDDGPRKDETSWKNSLKAYAYAPDAFASYLYAAAAADAARLLKVYAPDRAEVYAASAVKAMRWALQSSVPKEYADGIDLYRITAAAALYRLDGNPRWHQEFLTRNPLVNEPSKWLACHGHDICDAAYDYVRSTDRPRNQKVLDNALESIRLDAEAALGGVNSTAYGWALDHPFVPLVWGLGPGTPKVTALMRGYLLFGKTDYRAAATRSASFTLGANALDESFVTGLGHRNPTNPLIVDVNVGGLPLWPGTPVYGIHTFGADDEWFLKYVLRPNGVTPDPAGVPFMRSWYDVSSFAANNEFTVFQSHARTLYAFGALAGLAVLH